MPKSFLLSNTKTPPMASPDDPAPENNDVTIVARQAPNPPTQLFFPHNHYYLCAPPPIYFIYGSNFPPPPSIWVYYPLWYIHPNPNQFVSTQELPPNPTRQELTLAPTSSRRVFGCRSYGRDKKVTWCRKIKHEVESSGDHITTVMLRNIPNRYTCGDEMMRHLLKLMNDNICRKEMMIEYMDKHCEEANESGKDEEFTISAYDFLYLPIDFKTNMNKGYAFVNFTNAKAVSKFKAANNHKPWSHFHSRKELEITSARIQGKNELVRRFQHRKYPVEAYSAVCFSPPRSGGKNTVQTTMVGKCIKPMSSV